MMSPVLSRPPGPRLLGQRAALLFELFLVDLAARVTLLEDLQRSLWWRALRAGRPPPEIAEQQRERDDHQDPEQGHADHADTHPAPAGMKPIAPHGVSPSPYFLETIVGQTQVRVRRVVWQGATAHRFHLAKRRAIHPGPRIFGRK